MKPLAHQKEAILAIESNRGRTVLADDMGLGKTVTALGCIRRNRSWLPSLVVCPASVKINWQREAHKMGIQSAICSGTRPPTERGILHSSGALQIVNYDILKHWVDYFKSLKFQFLILDESQYLANRKSDRTKAARKLSRFVPRVIAMSGTPILNRPSELFPTLNIVWPKQFRNFQIYANRYCNPKMTPFGMDYSGSANLDHLHKSLVDLGMIRRTKDNILNLPTKERRVIRAPLDNPREYQQARDDFDLWLRSRDPAKAHSTLKAASLAKVRFLLHLAARLKIRSICRKINVWLHDNPNQKVVIVHIHRDIGAMIEDLIEVESVSINGSVTGHKRQLAVDTFQKNRSVRAAICNIKAAGVGVDGLQNAASRLAFVELWYNPASHTQCEDRVYRIGQDKPVQIDYVVGKDTIEERVCKILQSRQKIISAAIDGDQESQSFNVYEELLGEMRRDYE